MQGDASAVYEAPVGRTMMGRVVQSAHGYEAQLVCHDQVVERCRNNVRERRALTLDEAMAQVGAWHEHEVRCGHG
jgi:hypothetical protein